MATKTLKTRLQNKADTQANWALAANSFKPLKGEVCVYTDINKIKIGDGTHFINELEFVETDISSKLTTPSGGTTGQVIKKTADGVAWQDDVGADYFSVVDGKLCISYEGGTP